ncbi:hypothetical protein Tco_0932541 [Tanacetum coccineum]
MAESAKRHEENSNIIKEIRASTDAAIRNQGALIKTLEIQIGQMSKVLQDRGFGSMPSSTETNPRDQFKSISTAEADFFEILQKISSSRTVPSMEWRILLPSFRRASKSSSKISSILKQDIFMGLHVWVEFVLKNGELSSLRRKTVKFVRSLSCCAFSSLE